MGPWPGPARGPRPFGGRRPDTVPRGRRFPPLPVCRPPPSGALRHYNDRMTKTPVPASVTGLVLAGGRGSRMGGLDKGLTELAGRPMVAHVIDRLRPQVAHVIVNANRHQETYGGFGFPVVADASDGYPGPLAGFAAGLAAASTPWLVTVPCDCPLLPPDLVPRLTAAQTDSDAEIVSAHDGGRLQPVFTLLRRDLLASLESFMAEGERKIDRWFARHHAATADFSDQPEAFENVNRPADRERIETRLLRGHPATGSEQPQRRLP